MSLFLYRVLFFSFSLALQYTTIAEVLSATLPYWVSGISSLTMFVTLAGVMFSPYAGVGGLVIASFLQLSGPYLPGFLLGPLQADAIFRLCSGAYFARTIPALVHRLLDWVDSPTFVNALARLFSFIGIYWVFVWCFANLFGLFLFSGFLVGYPITLLFTAFLVSFPLIIFMNLQFVLSFVSILYYFSTGAHPQALTDLGVFATPFYFRFRMFIRDPLASAASAFSALPAMVRFIRLSTFMARLPLELVMNILGNLTPAEPKRRWVAAPSRWSRFRVFLALDIFCAMVLVPRLLILWITFIPLLFSFMFLIASILFFRGQTHMYILMIVIRYPFHLLGSTWSTRYVTEFLLSFPRALKVSVCNVFLMANDLFNPAFDLCVQTRLGQFTYTIRTDPTTLDDNHLNVLFQESLVTTIPIFLYQLLFLFLFLLSTIVQNLGRVFLRVFYLPALVVRALAWSLIPFMIPDEIIDLFATTFTYLVIKLDRSNFFGIVRGIFKLVKIVPVGFWNFLALPDEEVDDITEVTVDHGALRGGRSGDLSSVFLIKTPNLLRKWTLRTVTALNDFRLPEFISAQYKAPTVASISRTYQDLAGLGLSALPGFVDSLGDEAEATYLAEHADLLQWFLGSSNYRLGFRALKTAYHSWSPLDFRPEWIGNRHSSTFTGLWEEIRSTARYWTGNHKTTLEKHDFDDVLDGLWEGVKIQFASSKLTPPELIFQRWVKKYNMGFGFGVFHKDGTIRQLSRRQIIKGMGGDGAFVQFWKDVFKVSATLDQPSPVFTKMENLKLKKAFSRSVRTIIGSPFAHHVLTTVFNYQPNHNYHLWSTPMKVGMPSNGVTLNRLWTSLMGHDAVFAGDMTAFDSTQAPPILEMVKRLRQRGFEGHKDQDRICELIDVAYDKLLTQPMGFKNFGDIFGKGQGFTTGHSSTSTDNSLALIINYLFAWRVVTGLPSRDFYKYNTLANFGDDHVLGYDRVFGWSPETAMRAMARLGTQMRDEAPGVTSLPTVAATPPPGGWVEGKFSFLAKVPLPITSEIRLELDEAGIKIPLNFATCHDPERLTKKLKGEVLARSVSDTYRSYQVLLAYIDLTAHHQLIYKVLSKKAANMLQDNKAAWLARGIKEKNIRPAKSYNDVLRQWYSGSVHVGTPLSPEEEEDLDESQVGFEIIDDQDVWGVLVRWVADFPTFLSPRYKNLSWADWLQLKLAARLSWPLALIAQGGGITNDPTVVRTLLSKGPYSFLRSDSLQVVDVPFSSLLVRHWIFMAYSSIFRRKGRSPSFFDLFRFFDSFFVNFWFMLTGHITQVVVELDVHIFETILVFLLSFLDFDVPWVTPVLWNPPSPSWFAADLFTRFFRWISPSGSIDFQPLDARLRLLSVDPEQSFVLSAPTGTGKSTRMVIRISEAVRRRVIVILPRAILVREVGRYMREVFGHRLRIGLATEGFKPRGDEPVIYSTVQSFMASPNLRLPGSVFVCDEAHIDEPAYNTMIEWLKRSNQRVIFVSATPPAHLDYDVVHIPAISQFTLQTITNVVRSPKNYRDQVTKFLKGRLGVEKTLVFVPNLKMAHKLRDRLAPGTATIISSKHKDFDREASVFISTNVSDAGLTLPDVSHVFSMDYDVRVTLDMVDHTQESDYESRVDSGRDNSVRVYSTKLTESQLLQRRGRTGRTCDGYFHLYKVMDRVVEPVSFQPFDYIGAFPVALSYAANFFPAEIRGSLEDDVITAFPLFEATPGWTYSRFLRAYNAYLDIIEDSGELMSWETYVGNAAPLIGSHPDTFMFGDLDKDVAPMFETGIRDLEAFEALDLDDEAEFGDDVFYAADADESLPTDQDFLAPLPAPHSRVNVSGASDLCGVECFRGLVWTHLRANMTRDLAVDHLLRIQTGPSPQMSNFGYDIIRDALWIHFGLVCRLNSNGTLLPRPSFPRSERAPEVLLYLERRFGRGHYNYHGLPLPGPGTDVGIPQSQGNLVTDPVEAAHAAAVAIPPLPYDPVAVPDVDVSPWS